MQRLKIQRTPFISIYTDAKGFREVTDKYHPGFAISASGLTSIKQAACKRLFWAYLIDFQAQALALASRVNTPACLTLVKHLSSGISLPY